MRVFPGGFHYFERAEHPDRQESFAPAILVEAAWRDRRAHVNLLIDTGTENTILFPRQAREIFGRDLERFEFDNPDRRILIGDVGGTFHAAIEETVDLIFHDETDAPSTSSARVLVVQPSPTDLADPNVARSNWDTPSLLGRDLLLHFDLHMSGARGEVYLSLPD